MYYRYKMRNRKNQEITEILRDKVSDYLKYLILLGLIVVASSLVRNIFKAISIRKRIEIEKDEIQALERQKQELEQKVAESESNEFIEKQLRDKLGLAKEGEIVLVLPEEEILKKIAPVIETEEDVLPDPTWKKWFKLFL